MLTTCLQQHNTLALVDSTGHPTHEYDKICALCRTFGPNLTTSRRYQRPLNMHTNAVVPRNRPYCLPCELGFYMTISSRTVDLLLQPAFSAAATGLMALVAVLFYNHWYRLPRCLQRKASPSHFLVSCSRPKVTNEKKQMRKGVLPSQKKVALFMRVGLRPLLHCSRRSTNPQLSYCLILLQAQRRFPLKAWPLFTSVPRQQNSACSSLTGRLSLVCSPFYGPLPELPYSQRFCIVIGGRRYSQTTQGWTAWLMALSKPFLLRYNNSIFFLCSALPY